MSPSSAFIEPINSIIGEEAEFSGDFKLKGSLRIDGVFSGKIISEGKVIVGKTGHVKTNIKARNVIIAGRVDGNIYAFETAELLSEAQIQGDIIASNLKMQDGVIFEGRAQIKTIENEDSFFEKNR